MDSTNRIWELLSKKEDNDLSAEEKDELIQRLRENPALAAANAAFEEILSQEINVVEQPVNPADSWALIKSRMGESETAKKVYLRPNVRKLLAAASVLLVVVAASVWGYNRFSANQPTHPIAANQVSTPLGSRSKVDLPDGTKVWLNAGSRIAYNDFQKTGTREVTLSGEAYFDVVHSATRPFIVHTRNADIYDLGTVFTVKAYPQDQHVETTLIEGSVEVTDHRNRKEKILLHPNQKLTLYLTPITTGKSVETQSFKIASLEKNTKGLIAETAWIDNKLVFNNDSFQDLANRMERWYNVKIHFDSSGIAKTPFSGTIENETIDQALEAMRFSTSFHYRIDENDVWITK